MRRERKPRGIEDPDFAAAGAFIRAEIERTGLSIKEWSSRHGLAAATIYKICQGRYNFGQECSIAKLWELARKSRPLDYDAQQEYVYHVLQLAGMLPPPDRMTLTYALNAFQREAARLIVTVKKIEAQTDRRDRQRDRLATEYEQEAAS